MKPGREEYGDWLLIISSESATPMHIHPEGEWKVHYAVTTEFKCRECGEQLPPGVQFRVRFLNVGS